MKNDIKRMRIPEDLAESMLEQAYADRPFELLAWALGYACRILEALTDEETAMTFNKESSALLTNSIKSYVEAHQRCQQLELTKAFYNGDSK